MKLSVIICTYNRYRLLKGCLKSLRAQTAGWSNVEVIVVDNNSSDSTREVVKGFPDVRYVLERNQGLSFARNRGYKEATGEYVAYIDDDAKVGGTWLRELMDAVEHGTPDIIGGPIFPMYVKKKPAWFKNRYETFQWGRRKRYLTDREKRYGFSGSNMVFKKLVLEENGGFDTGLGMSGKKIQLGEDTEFFYRIRNRYEMLYLPGMKVYHRVNPSHYNLRHLARRTFRSGRDSVSFITEVKNEAIADKIIFIAKRMVLFPYNFCRTGGHVQNKIIGYLFPAVRKFGEIIGAIALED